MATAKELWEVLCWGLRDFVAHTPCDDVVVGLSGGIDSAVVTCIAVEALGKEHVEVIAMPSRYSSAESLADAAELATRLDIPLCNIPVGPPLLSFEGLLGEHGYKVEGITLENLQARIRAVILMAHANERNALVLNTGNKSESMMGYCTLYGDSIGAVSPIGNVLKTDVYKLAYYINSPARRYPEVIPQNIIDKAPSAELRPDHKDSDDIPPYHVLDPILRRYEEGLIPSFAGATEQEQDIIARMKVSRFKRDQCPRSLPAPRCIEEV